jgi:hypothetical protein
MSHTSSTRGRNEKQHHVTLLSKKTKRLDQLVIQA